MKKLRLALSSAALTFLLSVSTSAGIITTGSSQPPPPPPPATSSVETDGDAAEAEGVMSTGIMTTGVASPESVEVIALSVLQSVLALF